MQLAKIHTEAIYAGEMKHGPLALVNPIQQNSSKSYSFFLLNSIILCIFSYFLDF
jgi:hypothetical protein